MGQTMGHSEERSPMGQTSNLFVDWVTDDGMIELGFNGPRYTWSHGNIATQRRNAHLDRSLCNEQWRHLFPEASILHCSHEYSEHCPILLKTKCVMPVRLGDRPFRFQAAWLTDRRFIAFVKESWPHRGSLLQRTDQLAQSTKVWNRTIFGNILHRKNRLRSRMAGVQRQLAVRPTTAMLKLDHRLKKMWEETLAQEELLWYQKSRVDWLQARDRNTRFFHLSTIVRRERNKIVALKSCEDNWITDRLEMKNKMVHYYRTLYATDVQARGNFTTGFFPTLTTSNFQKLRSRYTKEEVYAALKDIAPFKAPGPDGFHASFYQQLWDVVGDSVASSTLRAL